MNLDMALDLEDAGHILGSCLADFTEKTLHSSPELRTSRLMRRRKKDKVSSDFLFLLAQPNPNGHSQITFLKDLPDFIVISELKISSTFL